MAPARKVPKTRPDVALLLKSRKRLAGYTVALKLQGKSFTAAAKELGVTPKQLKNYLFQRPEKTIASFNRGKDLPYRRLFNQSVTIRKEEKYEVTGYTIIQGKRVPRREKVIKRYRDWTEPIRGVVPLRQDEASDDELRLLKQYYKSVNRGLIPSLDASLRWEEYTDKKGIPTSIDEIRELYADREINKRQAASILRAWRNVYSNMSDDHFDEVIDDFAEYDDLY